MERDDAQRRPAKCSGAIRPDVISAITTAPGFTANIVIQVVSGKRLDVALSAHGTSINRVAGVDEALKGKGKVEASVARRLRTPPRSANP